MTFPARLLLLVMLVASSQTWADEDNAVRWLRGAAEQGSAHSQFLLGARYATGEGVPEDDAEAVRW